MDNNVKNVIDKIWLTFHSGGVANPLTVIEQITYLLFIKGLDDIELKNENDDVLLGIPSTKKIFDDKHKNCRWSVFKDFEASRMFKTVQEEVFPFIKTLGDNKESSYAKYMEDAIFLVPTPIVLQKVVTAIDNIDRKSVV